MAEEDQAIEEIKKVRQQGESKAQLLCSGIGAEWSFDNDLHAYSFDGFANCHHLPIQGFMDRRLSNRVAKHIG